MTEWRIAGRRIARDEPVYILAEVGATACGDVETAKALASAAMDAGADAIKYQCVDPTILGKPDANYPHETVNGWRHDRIYDLVAPLVFDKNQWIEVFLHARSVGLTAFATADSEAGVAMLAKIAPAWKCCAWDITHIPLLRAMAATGVPVLIDIGTCTEEEMLDALEAGGPNVLANGPAALPMLAPHPSMTVNWNLSRLAHGTWGFSSPAREWTVDAMAMGFGVVALEKRLTLNRRSLVGHHHWASLEPDEFTEWVKAMRALDDIRQEPAFFGSAGAWMDRQEWGRSLYAARDLPAGTILTADDIAITRPGGGRAPVTKASLIGTMLEATKKQGEAL